MDRATIDPKQIFLAAVENHTPDQWNIFLEQACGGDTELRLRVTELLAAHVQSNSLLDGEGLLDFCSVEPIMERPGMSIGPYKLLEQIGEGGFGVIFMAEQQQPIRRKVALKVLKPGVDTRQVMARFEAERQVLALMDHPNIARVLDAGASESGRPYFVMELVRGIPITEYCDQFRLTMRERLELLVDVCLAVQHAHQKGIIHRDLKPANLLVTRRDGRPLVKVIDFGVAKATGRHLTDKTLFTGFAQLIGTPLYMSPEQAALSAVDVDTRSDVFSLGVVMYELLTSSTPFDSATLKRVGLDELRRIICEVEPSRPSARVSTLNAVNSCTIAESRQVDPSRLCQQLRGELDWIVMKAMEKDRGRRYQSASALGADVERYLHGEPVEAFPPSSLYRMTKFARRNKLALATVCAVVAALLLGTGISLWQANEANRAHQLAQQHLESERKALTDTVEQKTRLRLQLYATDMSLAPHVWEQGDTARCMDLLERHRPLPEERDLRGFEWHYLWNVAQQRLQTWDAHASPILTADASPYDRFIASADRAGVVHIWDLATQSKLQTLQFTDQETCAVRFSPDGLLLATAGQDRLIRLWDVTTWTETARLTGHERTICSLAWSPDSSQLASASRDHSVRIWNVSQQQEVRSLAGHSDVVRCVAWSPDGKLLASAGADMLIRLWDTTTWDPAGELQGHDDGLLALAFSPCGRWLASAGYNTSVLVHDVGQRKVLAQIAEPGNVWSLAFSPDSNLLVVGGSEGRLDLYGLNSMDKRLDHLHSNRELTDAIRAVVFVQHGEMLLMASEVDRSLGLQRVVPLVGHASFSLPWTCHTLDGDRKLAATSDASGVVAIRSLPGAEVQQQIAAHKAVVHDVAFSPRGDILASCSADGRVCLSDLQTGKLLHNLEAGAPPVRHLTFSPDGDLLAGGGEDGSVRLWQTATGALLHQLRVPPGGIVQAVFSADGRRLAAGSYDQILLWDAVSGDRLALLDSTRLGVYGLAFSPDGSKLAVGGDSHVSLWDIAAGEELAVMLGHRGGVWSVAFSPDGQTLATFAGDQSVRLWHVPTRRELFTLLRSDRPLNWLQFTSPHTLLVGMAPDEQGVSEVAVFAGNAITEAVGSRIGHTSLSSQAEPADSPRFVDDL